jgi:hypothetical protein
MLAGTFLFPHHLFRQHPKTTFLSNFSPDCVPVRMTDLYLLTFGASPILI